MQVIELAEDLRVDADGLIALLRKMGIPVADEEATITDGQMAKVFAKVERERRAGHEDPADAIHAALEEAAVSSTRRRRRRRSSMPEQEPAVDAVAGGEASDEEVEVTEATEDAAAAVDAEADTAQADVEEAADSEEPEEVDLVRRCRGERRRSRGRGDRSECRWGGGRRGCRAGRRGGAQGVTRSSPRRRAGRSGSHDPSPDAGSRGQRRSRRTGPHSGRGLYG